MEGLASLPSPATPATPFSYPLLPSSGHVPPLHHHFHNGAEVSAPVKQEEDSYLIDAIMGLLIESLLQQRVRTHLLTSAWTTLGLPLGA